MNAENDAVASLREALKVSPNNLPLREHLANTLLSLGRAEEAEQEFRQALALSPDHAKLKTGLARAFAQQGKNSEALAVLESLIKLPNCPPAAHLYFARLIVKSGQMELAERHYRKAIAADPSLADPQFAAQF